MLVPGIITFFIPDVVVFVRMKMRQRSIVQHLPNMLDLMVLCIDAGLGIDAALLRIARRSTLSNALNEELGVVGNDIIFGMRREQAYRELFHRTGVEELRTFGSTLNQCSKRGLSISNVVRAQSQFVRTTLANKAETKASKLPIWMSFPLCLCILPAVLIILVSPALINMSSTVSQFMHHQH